MSVLASVCTGVERAHAVMMIPPEKHRRREMTSATRPSLNVCSILIRKPLNMNNRGILLSLGIAGRQASALENGTAADVRGSNEAER